MIVKMVPPKIVTSRKLLPAFWSVTLISLFTSMLRQVSIEVFLPQKALAAETTRQELVTVYSLVVTGKHAS
jgi:hypothetical protein